MQERLKGKVIVVGGAGGIGDGLAWRYAREGAAVVLGDIDGDRAVAVAQEIAASGATCIGTYLDGGDEASIRELVDLAVTTFAVSMGSMPTMPGSTMAIRPAMSPTSRWKTTTT